MAGCTCGGWIMSNGLCACGLAPDQRHVHRPMKEATGHMVCMDCHAVIIEPILSDKDPRLAAAYTSYPPLPVLLVELWRRNQADPAQYIEDAAMLDSKLNVNREFWDMVFEQYN